MLALVALGCDPREPMRAAGALDDERRVIASVVNSVLGDTPRRAVGVVVTDAQGARFHVFGARDAQGSPFDQDTTFEIGSVSKVFAGLLLADAELRGEVALQDPIARHLPDWQLPSRDGVAMTLWHAVTHTTSLPLMPDNWVKTSGGVTRYTEQMFRDNLATHVLASVPGERYVYGNLNTALIGLALTHRTGLAYSALLQERIFDPLGMRRSGYPDERQRIDDNVLDGYEADDTPSVPRLDVSPLGPCCVVRSTLRDMGRFAAAALEDGGPLAAAFARAAEPQRAIDPNEPDWRAIALGWEVDPRLGLLRKNGQVSGYRCDLVLQPGARRGLFVIVNSMRAKIVDFSDAVVRALWDPRPRSAPSASAAARVEQLPPTAVQARATFGDAIALEGWETPAHAEPGRSIEVALYWRVLAAPDDDYRVFVHGDPPASGAERAAGDHFVRATSTRDWQPGMLIRDRFQLAIPSSFPTGEMTLWLGWYRNARRLAARSDARAIDDNRLPGPSIAIDPMSY
ncbi:MAG TPA: serine hydrolase domain-containing protein [Polyangiales bacterium]|nr:serine hydrolase domain-containing protein [Polyangiales bacterium]